MGRRKQLKGRSKSKPSNRVVASVDLSRDSQRLYYVQGTSVYSSPRRGVQGSKRHEADISNFSPRADCLYYLKGSNVMEAPFARR